MYEALGDLSLDLLRAFEAAARHRSFTAAAMELGTTQPAVSQQIKRLEEQLAVRLFDRIYRGIELTDAGMLLFEHVHGESRDRGQAMVDLMAQYERHGLQLDSRELPDHLPLYLEYLAQLPEEEAKEFLSALGLEEAGLDRLIRAGYHLLDLITYFTVGPKECRAWTIVRGTKAPAAAGVIHTDFERGFIRAFTIGYDDYVAFKGEVGAKEAGKGRDEGKEYVVQDGDVIHFRFNT